MTKQEFENAQETNAAFENLKYTREALDEGIKKLRGMPIHEPAIEAMRKAAGRWYKLYEAEVTNNYNKIFKTDEP